MAQTTELIPALPQWDHFFVLGASAGYTDNTTLAHAAPEASPFLKWTAEAMVFNLDLDGPQFSAFVSGDVRQFFSSPSLDQEEVVFGQAQWKRPIHDHGAVSMAAEYFFQDQVLDVSTTETNQEPVQVQGHTLTLRPAWRLNLLGASWWSLEMPVMRQWFRTPLDPYWEAGPKVTLGYDYGRRSYVSLSYEASWRAYDREELLTAQREPQPGTHRRYWQHDTRLTWRHYWDRARHWRTTTRLEFKAIRDNGEGFFDFDRLASSAELRYRTKSWELRGRVRGLYYRYPVQTVSRTDPRKRERTELSFTLDGERKLTRSLSLVAGYEHELTVANQTSESYSVNTFTGGIHWEF